MSLAERQAALVAALVAGDGPPPGFDPARVRATADQLLRKRAGEVGRAWPWLRASLGPRWTAEFTAWAAGRPPRGSQRDGFDFAQTREDLDEYARAELADRERQWDDDGAQPLRPRRSPLRRWWPRRS
ncbi:hypothetical protein [Hamadaea tsunoensis]|uniref:hypothetical protein n=1 Tax=Hamadaea tsunoensis TaxID=53368 RepID=UPI0003F6D8C8